VTHAACYATDLQQSNGCAALRPGRKPSACPLLLVCLVLLAAPGPVSAQPEHQEGAQQSDSTGKRIASFLVGGAIGLGAHEMGHVVADLALGQTPEIKKVEFHGIPFFAITHPSGLSPWKEFTISSAGFWVQNVENEVLLHRRPNLRSEQAPLAKGVFAFNVITSAAYAGAAFAKTGPPERDTRGMAESAPVDERVVGVFLLAPAILDSWRYFHPPSKRAMWASRAIKIGMAFLIFR
jgi:hypothetical protein